MQPKRRPMEQPSSQPDPASPLGQREAEYRAVLVYLRPMVGLVLVHGDGAFLLCHSSQQSHRHGTKANVNTDPVFHDHL